MFTSSSVCDGTSVCTPGVADHRPEVHELVELEADPEQEVALEDPRRHPRVAHGPEQDRVGVPEGFEVRVREGLPGPQVPVGAEIELDQLDVEAVPHRLEDLQGLGDDLRPGPVAPDHADPVRAGTGVEPVRPCLGGDRRGHGLTSFSPVAGSFSAVLFVAVLSVAVPIDVSSTAAARLIAAR